MASENLQIIIGNLGRDPEMRYSASGQAKTEFSVATSRRWKKDEEWQEETTWFNVVCWGARGERVAEWARKGMQVYIRGRTDNRSWDDEKTGQKKYRSEVVADTVLPMGRKGEDAGAYEAPAGDFGTNAPRGAQAPATARHELDDLPF